MAEDNYASAEELLGYEDMEPMDIVVKSYGGKRIQVRPVTLSELSRIRQEVSRVKDPQGQRDVLYQKLLHLSAVQPRLTEDQVKFLWTKSAKAGIEIIDGLNKVNGMADSEEEAAAQQEADERSFPSGPGPVQPVVAGVGDEGSSPAAVSPNAIAPGYSNVGGIPQG